jgi:hypothetical protein
MIRDPKWTRRELEQLKTQYETAMPYLAIAESLGRSVSAIKTRAQLCGFRRPGRAGRKEIDALITRAIELGLDESVLPSNPTALRVLAYLAMKEISTKSDLVKHCVTGESAVSKAVHLLRSLGLVYVDDFRNPAELVLTRKAYRIRPEPVIADEDQIRAGVLPSTAALNGALDVWLSVIGRSQTISERYREFAIRQLENAESGDVRPGSFYSMFYCSR